MSAKESVDHETKIRLLDAAGQVFAERGPARASVREICRRAGANIAAVNYHFGGKDALYMQVVQHWTRIAHEAHPPGGESTPDAPAAERLRRFIHAFLSRVLDTRRPPWRAKLLAWEMAEPTAALDELIERYYRPLARQLEGIIRELLGPDADGTTVTRCATSIFGQCLYYPHARAVLARLYPRERIDASAIDRLAEHIADFSLAALTTMARAERRGEVRS